MNEFAISMLPRMIGNSNFASFVRQLNMYDFHKVKNCDENQYHDGEHVSLTYDATNIATSERSILML